MIVKLYHYHILHKNILVTGDIFKEISAHQVAELEVQKNKVFQIHSHKSLRDRNPKHKSSKEECSQSSARGMGRGGKEWRRMRFLLSHPSLRVKLLQSDGNIKNGEKGQRRTVTLQIIPSPSLPFFTMTPWPE